MVGLWDKPWYQCSHSYRSECHSLQKKGFTVAILVYIFLLPLLGRWQQRLMWEEAALAASVSFLATMLLKQERGSISRSPVLAGCLEVGMPGPACLFRKLGFASYAFVPFGKS